MGPSNFQIQIPERRCEINDLVAIGTQVHNGIRLERKSPYYCHVRVFSYNDPRTRVTKRLQITKCEKIQRHAVIRIEKLEKNFSFLTRYCT